MNNGLKERLKELENRDAAAGALGHGFLDCPDAIRAQVADILLHHVKTPAARLDIMLAMENQDIEPSTRFKEEYTVAVTRERERRQRQAENARLAREEHADFRAWKAGRPQRVKAQTEINSGKGSGKSIAVRVSSDDE